LPFRRKFNLFGKGRRLFDYKRTCDRCAVDGWLRSQLRREEQTELLVCIPCFDKRVEQYEPNTLSFDDGRFEID